VGLAIVRHPLGACALIVLGLTVSGCRSLRRVEDPQAVVRGPIAARIEHPLALNFLGFRPRSARVTETGEQRIAVESAYTSLFEDGINTGTTVVFDGELWHSGLSLRTGVIDGGELEVELQFLYASSGFLDTFVESFHELFGFGNGGREKRPQDAYAMEIVTPSGTIYDFEGDHFGLGDLPLIWTQQIIADPSLGEYVAWRAGVELPLGSESKGFGNGGIDVGFGLLGERSFGRWTATGAVDAVVPAQPDSLDDADVRIDTRFDAQLGVEYRWSDELSWLAGAVWLSPLTGDLDLEEIDGHFLDFGVGAAWDAGERSRLRLSFHEDLISDSGADFSVLFAWTLVL
jgi:hypothetical protein